MLQSIPRRLLLRSTRCSSLSISPCKLALTFTRRPFAITTPCSKNDPKQPISDFVASQTPPSNPETPPDRMPHQTEEDIASEKIFDNQPTKEDRLPPEAVPVEQVIKETPGAMKKAPRVIKEEESPATIGTGHKGQTDSKDQAVTGHSGMPHVNEENIAYERIISGEEASGTSSSAPGEETPAAGVPIEEAIGDGEKPSVMESSTRDEEPPSGGQPLRSDIGGTVDESTESARKSILDLFETDARPKKGGKQSTKATTASARTEQRNPLSSQGLDKTELDLSAWESARSADARSDVETDPERWAGRDRGTWESEELHHDEPTPETIAIQETFQRMPKPSGRKKAPPFDLRLPQTESIPTSPWDYFYPPPPPPKSLSAALQQEYESRHPEARKKGDKGGYDPYAAKQKTTRWPFLHNRDELVNLCINHMMKHGKKATAEKIMQDVFFQILRYFPRQHPVTVLAEAVDRNAPLMKNSTTRMGGKAVVKPVALNERQRIRAGWMIMVRSAARAAKGAIPTPFQDRLSIEIIKTMEGRGAGAAMRQQVHQTAMANKLNVQVPKKMNV